MKTLRMTVMLLVLAGAALGVRAAETPRMADLVPAQAGALVEIENAAGMRDMLLDSAFWAALQNTQAARQWHASEAYMRAQESIERLLGNLEMTREQALKTYLGGRSALVLLPAPGEKPYGVFLTEATNEMAEKLIKAVGGIEIDRHKDIRVWEVTKDNHVDHMAFAGGVLMITRPRADELEQVLDVVVGGGAALGRDASFVKTVEGLPAGWRVRAFGAQIPPLKCPGAVAMYPDKDAGRLHFEWRMMTGPNDLFSINRPVALAGPTSLPDSAVAAVTSVLHTQALYEKAEKKILEQADGEEKLRKAKMFIRGWFPGHSIESIVGAFGPEAAGALVKGENGSAPGLVCMARLTASGKPVAHAFKDGLAAKAMIFGALGQKGENPVVVSVREEAYGDASMVIIEAPEALRKMLGNWADDIGLTIAVTGDWLIVGTTPAGVKRTIDTASGKGGSLADAMTAAGEKVPAGPVTRWGVLRPAEGAAIVLDWAEKLLGRERVEQARHLTNLAELMNLVKHVLWQRTDEPEVMRGAADVQAVK